MNKQVDIHPILGAGSNHIQGIREALLWTLGGSALLDLRQTAVVEWLENQGLSVPVSIKEPISAGNLIFRSSEAYLDEKMGRLRGQFAAQSSSLQNPQSKKQGLQRSGGGWSNGAAFCIGSAFVRALGALEQFELDVLKSLLYYRPHGHPLGEPDDNEDITVELCVLQEEPEKKEDVEYYSKPALWTWLKRQALDKEERRKLFKRVYDIELAPGAERKAASETNKRRSSWFNKRNEIAHGRSDPKISLAEFLDLDAFVTESMLHIANQCQEKQKLVV